MAATNNPVPSIEQYAAAQRRVARVAQHKFGQWLLNNPGATRQQAGEAAKRIIATYAPVAEHLADTYFDAATKE